MARVSLQPSEDADITPPSDDAPAPAAAPQADRPLPPLPAVGGSYLLDETSWQWVLQPNE